MTILYSEPGTHADNTKTWTISLDGTGEIGTVTRITPGQSAWSQYRATVNGFQIDEIYPRLMVAAAAVKVSYERSTAL